MELREYFNPILKWWWLIVAATVIAGVSSYFATRQQPQVYTSTATLMIGSAIDDPNPSNSDLFITQSLATLYVDFTKRDSLRNDVKEALGLNRLPEYFVQNVNNTNIIDIAVTDTDPQRAQAVAAELTRQIILRSPTAEERDFAQRLLENYEVSIAETEAEIAAKQEELGESFSARDIANVQAEIAALESSLQNLETNYARLLAGSRQGATNTVRVLDPATLPSGPVNSNNALTILTASGIGFILAVFAAYLLEYLDDTVSTPERITRLTDLPTLAGISMIHGDDKLVALSKPRSPMSEAFRVLRTAVQFSTMDRSNSILVVTSAVPEEGKSTTVSNLAVVLAQAGSDVVLVDGDLRRPSLHRIFDLPNKRGVTSLLLKMQGDAAESEVNNLVEDTILPTQVEGLQIMTCGPIPPNPSELLGSTKMKRMLDVLSSQYDYVILDSPPILSVTDAAVLSAQAGGTYIVVRANKSRKGELKQAVERLQDVNANIVGCVLNGLRSGSDGHSFYHYYKDPYPSLEDEEDVDSQEDGPTGKLRKRFLRGQEAVQS